MSEKFTTADVFSFERFSERVYILKESYSTQHRFPIGVVVGDQKAYVIDSGLGMAGDLRKYIEENITDKPLVCIVTHGHLDHASGAVLFDERYLNERDYPILGVALDLGKRTAVLPDFALNDEEIIAYGKANALDNTKMTAADFKSIEDGDVIDDGIRMEIIKMPGHTQGQIAVYIPEDKICFASDSLLKRTHFDKATKDGIAAYIPVLERFIEKVDPDTVIIPGHEQSYVGNYTGWPTMQLPKDLRQACEDVVNGKTEGDAFKPAFFKNLEQNGRTFTHIVGCASLLYNENIFKKVMDRKFTVNDIFSYEKMTDNVYIVKESYSWLHRFPIGVVVGNEKAYVIDSGLGCGGSLRKYIEDNITDKPLVCIVTHGHPDHAACAIEFDERYLNEADWPILEENLSKEKRVSDLDAFTLKDPEIIAFGTEHVNDCSGVTFKNIKDGDVFEDGAVKMEIIAMPGHSQGQIAVYLPKEKICFASDSLLKRTHFNSSTMANLKAYTKVLERFIGKVDPDTVIIPGHEQSYVGNYTGWPTVQLPIDLKKAIEEVCAHQTEGDEIREAFFKHEQNNPFRTFTHVHGCASVIYSEKIYSE